MTVFPEFVTSVNVTLPILLLLLAGAGLKKTGTLTTEFCQVSDLLVFRYSLPALLFLALSEHPVDLAVSARLTGLGLGLTLVFCGGILVISGKLVPGPARGVFTQCAFRGNQAIIGIAVVAVACGKEYVAVAGIYASVVTILYNILAVLLLGSGSGLTALRKVIRNPLILGACAGFCWKLTGLTLPSVLSQALHSLAALTVPLALLSIGAGLRLDSLRNNRTAVFWISLIKLLITPLLAVLASMASGLGPAEQSILFIMMATPTAASAYIMSESMSDYGKLAGEAVAVTTLLSPLVLAAGLTALNLLQAG